MEQKFIIKDIHKEKVVYLQGKDFSESQSIALVEKIVSHLLEKNAGISSLPVIVINEDQGFDVCMPIKELDLKESGDFKIKTLPAHRMGVIVHQEFKKPLRLSEDFLERQLRYQGFSLIRPYRYIFHPNPAEPKIPIIEIQIPVIK